MSSDGPVTDAGPDAGPDGPDAEAIAAAVRGVPGVHDLHSGLLDDVAARVPGRRVPGIRVPRADSEEPLEVHVVLAWGCSALETAEAVRERVEALADGPVHVVVEDVAGPGEPVTLDAVPAAAPPDSPAPPLTPDPQPQPS